MFINIYYILFSLGFLLLISCDHKKRKSNTNTLAAVVLADANSSTVIDKSNDWINQLEKVIDSCTSQNGNFNFKKHEIPPLCGGCSNYRIISMTTNNEQEFFMPINDHRIYQYINSDKFQFYKDRLQMEKSLNYILSSNRVTDIETLNSLMDCLIDSLTMRPNLDFRITSTNADSLQLIKQIGNNDAVVWDKVKHELTLPNVVNRYYFYYNSILKFNFLTVSEGYRVNLELLNTEYFFSLNW